jgi:molybdate/tungstate transport system substrate-binding protein
MIIDKQRNPDVFVSAGTIPIKKLMEQNPSLAHWLVKFASAEIVIAYTPSSPFFDDLEKARKGELPWHEVLANDGLKFRRTDPELDPKGYYTIIVAKLANLHYNDPTIKDRILGEDRNTEQLLPEETLKTILEQGQIDASAAYKHEAVARGLPYITLPKEINLSDPTLSDFYKQASYTLSTGTVITGNTITFSVTIPETSRHMDGAIAFVKFLLSEKGMDLLEKDGLNPIKPTVEGDAEKIPSAIKGVVGD